MTRLRFVTTAFCCLLLAAAFAPSAAADVWNKKTIVTFPESTEIPGAVLPPGKYVFQLMDSSSNRHIVQVKNDREDHVYATILAIPNYRLEPKDKTVLSFYEMPTGKPQALRAWFYPGDNFGQEFPYPKHRATEIAQLTHENVPALPGNDESKTASDASAPAASTPSESPAPASEPVQMAQASPPPAQPAREPQPADESSDKMPQTASDLPGLALFGIGALGAAAAARFFRKRAT
jgi:hypothetical protein